MYKIFTLDNKNEWLELIKKFRDYDIYYYPSYLNAFYKNGDGEPFLFYYESQYGKVINVFLKRDISKDKKLNSLIEKNKYFDISTVYGYGGPIVEAIENEEELCNEYCNVFSSYCKENNIITEFLRFHPINKNHRMLENNYDIINVRKTIYMDISINEQYIWENITSKNRNMIRKAIKSGVKIICSKSNEIVDKFIELYNLTMNKDNAESYYYFSKEFFYETLNNENSTIFAAVLDEKIIACSIILFCNKFIHYHFSGSDPKYMYLAPNNLLLYEAAKWGNENGFSLFHLGGGYKGMDDSLFKFKKSFSKLEPLDFYIGKKIFNANSYEYLCDLRKECDKEYNKDTIFFPAYRG